MDIIRPKFRSAGHGTGKNLGKQTVIIGFKINSCDHTDQADPKKGNGDGENQVFVSFYHIHGSILL